MHDNARKVFVKCCMPWLQPGDQILEIGPEALPSASKQACDVHGLRFMRWDTLDIQPIEGLTYRAIDPYNYPIQPGEYDVIYSTQVAEHVPEVWRWVRELVRITRRMGIVITVCPANWPFHECPQDCWRIWPDGMRALYLSAGLEVLDVDCISLGEPDIYDTYAVGRKIRWSE